MEIINWDEECRLDLITGKGFRITEPAIKRSVKMYNGIQSERFGTDFDSEDGFKERYRCPKGCTCGKLYNGSICPTCGGKVKFRDIDLSITGWMILDSYKIIHPIMYQKLVNVIGDKALTEILTYDKKMLKDGQLEEKPSATNPFYGIGIDDFRRRFDEIIDYYKVKKKHKVEEFKELEEERSKIFTSCIPVYSAILRPMSFSGESLFYSTIDKKYNKIFTGVRLLNDISYYDKRLKKLAKTEREHLDRGHILTRIQADLMKLWEIVLDLVDGKDGQIQGQILGGMLNWSSRDVITPDPTLKADEIRLNYFAFLELYKFEILAHIVAINKVSYHEATQQFEMAKIEFNHKIYEIMNYMIKKNKLYVLINRNPTK